jgi:hypothetical protein
LLLINFNIFNIKENFMKDFIDSHPVHGDIQEMTMNEVNSVSGAGKTAGAAAGVAAGIGVAAFGAGWGAMAWEPHSLPRLWR